jgi:hypothetical protein
LVVLSDDGVDLGERIERNGPKARVSEREVGIELDGVFVGLNGCTYTLLGFTLGTGASDASSSGVSSAATSPAMASATAFWSEKTSSISRS